MKIANILRKMGISDGAKITQFTSAEDGSGYEVWCVEDAAQSYVLKKAKGCELAVYTAFFQHNVYGAPQLYKHLECEGEAYLLMEYVSGEDLCDCDREKLTAALGALIALQKVHWEDSSHQNAGLTFEKSLSGRRSRGEYLNDTELEQAYARYLELYSELPRTLCHDDLLPFNVLTDHETATIIDWEYAGILPYPTSLARLIAHGFEDENSLFRMKQEDKDFAIAYYYEHLIKEKGIGYAQYRNALDYFLLYEYCEWIMLGNRYTDADMERFRRYYDLAKNHVRSISF